MACNCNSSKCSCSKGNACDPSFTGDVCYDGNDFECEANESLNTPSGTNLNVILWSMLSTLCAMAGIALVNVGSGAGVFRDQVGWTFNLRSIVGGTGVTVTENADEILIEVDGGGVGTHVTVYCSSDRLGALEGSSILPGSALTSTSYTVPVGGAGTYEAYYTCDVNVSSTKEAQLRLDIDNVEADVAAKRIVSTDAATAKMNVMLMVCDITLAEGETVDIKGYKEDASVVFNNGVFILKKVG